MNTGWGKEQRMNTGWGKITTDEYRMRKKNKIFIQCEEKEQWMNTGWGKRTTDEYKMG